MTNNNRMNQSPSKGAAGPRMLPVVRIDGKLYFVDHRLRELRNVQNPHERLPIYRASGLPYLDIKPEDLPRPIILGGDAPFSYFGWLAARREHGLSGKHGAVRQQQGESGLTYVCIVCKRTLSRYDVSHNFAQCYSCRNPRIREQPDLEIRPVRAEEGMPRPARRWEPRGRW